MGLGQGLAVIVVCEVAWVPHPEVAVNVYVVVDCGWGISTKPLLGSPLATPAIVTLTPVPELSTAFQDKRTVWPPPIVTLLGDAEKLVIVGAAHAVAFTVACAEDVAPHPAVALNVYVVVDCGWDMSTKLFGLENVPTPGMDTVKPVPEDSVMDHCKRTMTFPPIVTLDGVAVNELIVGGGHALAVTVVCAVDCVPHPALAVSV